MPCIERTSQAKADAVEIWCTIAEENEAAADRLIDRVDERLRLLAAMPLSGESVDYIHRDVRRSTVGNYVIYYKPVDHGILLLRILHGARRHEGMV